jgi:hypothetical protein
VGRETGDSEGSQIRCSEEAGLGSLADQVLAILQAGDPSVMRDIQFQVGRTLEWLALRTKGKPSIVRNTRWGGRQPHAPWEFTVEDSERVYTFVLPKICGNLALAESREKQKPASPPPPPPPPPTVDDSLKRSPGCGIVATRSYARRLWTIELDAPGSAVGPVAPARVSQ